MHWCRTRLRLGSYIALFALAVQLVLAFGHVHLDGGGRQTRIEVSAATAAPAGHNGPKVADDFCAVCALIHLASTLVPAELAALPLPVVFGQLRRPESALHFALPASSPAAFAARAPPLA